MKKNFLFSAFCLLLTSLSFTANAQTRDQSLLCNTADVEIVIDNIIWNATPADMAPYDQNDFGTTQYPPVFHIAEISFDRPDGFHQYVESTMLYSVEVTVSTVNYDTDVPVYLAFADDLNAGVSTIGDGTGFRVFPDGTGDGVASTMAVMGRSAAYEPQNNFDCIEIITAHRIGKLKNGANCSLGNETYDHCEPIAIDVDHPESRIAMTDAANIDVYPNPVQNNLFVINNGLIINELSVMTLDGQIINHKTSIRRGVDRTQINTSQLDTGIYLLKLTTPTGIIVRKIIVQ